ncbi:MAG: trypsin-like peptidase domain-containing protein [Pseudomonadota bacterium]
MMTLGMRGHRLWLVGLGLGAAACGGGMERHVRRMFANEHLCDAAEVQVENESDGRFRASGCDRTELYTCGERQCLSASTLSSSPPARTSAKPVLREPKADPDLVGIAHREKNAGGAEVIVLDVRLDQETLLKLRATADGKKPVELTVVHLAAAPAPPNCELGAMIDGQRVELPKAKLLTKEVRDERHATILSTQLSGAIVRDLAAARQFAVRTCDTPATVPPEALPEVRHFALLYEEDLAWQAPAREGGTGGFLAPAGGWPVWKVTSTAPAAVIRGAALEGPALFKTLSRSVFRVVVTSNEGTMQGSAVAVSQAELLTNCHVVEGAQKITLQQGKLERKAELSRANPAADRCVLSVSEADLTPIRGVRSYDSLEVGEPLFTLGSPSGLELSLSNGLLSAKRDEKGAHIVQTTAPISPGSSGGGLFDAHGNLVGITTKVLVDRDRLNQSLNFAIPADSFWQP